MIQKATVVRGDLLSDIRDHGDVHGAETTRLTRLHSIFSVGELGVDGAANELTINGLKLSRLVAELANFSRADEGEVKGPEEKHNILSYDYKYP